MPVAVDSKIPSWVVRSDNGPGRVTDRDTRMKLPVRTPYCVSKTSCVRFKMMVFHMRMKSTRVIGSVSEMVEAIASYVSPLSVSWSPIRTTWVTISKSASILPKSRVIRELLNTGSGFAVVGGGAASVDAGSSAVSAILLVMSGTVVDDGD